MTDKTQVNKNAHNDDLIKNLFNLGDLDSEIPTVEELYKSL